MRNAKQKIIDKLTCRPISETWYPKYARHMPAHFCTLVNITPQSRKL